MVTRSGCFQNPEGSLTFPPSDCLPHLQYHSYFCYLRFVLPIFELSINGIIEQALFYFWLLSLNILWVRFIHLMVYTVIDLLLL